MLHIINLLGDNDLADEQYKSKSNNNVSVSRNTSRPFNKSQVPSPVLSLNKSDFPYNKYVRSQ